MNMQELIASLQENEQSELVEALRRLDGKKLTKRHAKDLPDGWSFIFDGRLFNQTEVYHAKTQTRFRLTFKGRDFVFSEFGKLNPWLPAAVERNRARVETVNDAECLAVLEHEAKELREAHAAFRAAYARLRATAERMGLGSDFHDIRREFCDDCVDPEDR